VPEVQIFIDEMLQFHKPKLVIIGVDFWWFNTERIDQTDFPSHQDRSDLITREKMTSPISWLWDRKLSVWRYFSIIAGRSENTIRSGDNLGIMATVQGNGFRPDGSFFQGNAYLAQNGRPNAFKEYLQRIDNANNGFEHGGSVGNRVQELRRLVEKIKSNGTDVVLFSTPLAPPVLQRLQESSDGYSYILEMHRELQQIGTEYYDFLSPNDTNNDPCEYLDGIHGGDVVYQKILLGMVNQNPNSAISQYIDAVSLQKAVVEFSGRTLSVFRPGDLKGKEVDFIGRGCPK
jgi:hypothetical protein